MPASSLKPAVWALCHGLSHPYVELVVQDYVGELPVSAIWSIFDGSGTGAKWNVQSLVSHGTISGIIFAAVARASLGGRHALCALLYMHGPERTIEQGRGTDVERLSRRVPEGGTVATVLRIKGGGVIARRPRAMLRPRRDSTGLGRGGLASHISRRGRDMGGTGTAWTVPHFGASGDLRAPSSVAFPRARALNSNGDVPAALTMTQLQIGRPVGHYGKSQLSIGRHAGWVAHLSLIAKDLHDLPQ